MANNTRRPALVVGVLPAALLIGAIGSAHGSSLVPQTQLTTDPTKDTTCIPKFAVELPVFGPAGNIPRVDAVAHPNLTVTLKEIDQQVLPQGMTDTCGMNPPVKFGTTRVWAYETSDTKTGKVLGQANWPAVTIEAKRQVPVTVHYVNQLPSFNPADPDGPGLVQGLLSMDQTVHWANPLGAACGVPVDCTDPANPTKQAAAGFGGLCTTPPLNRLDGGIRAKTHQWLRDLLRSVTGGATTISRLLLQPASASAANSCCQPFTGPIPATAHLHGAEIPAAFDGGPDTWFTPNGITGSEYVTDTYLYDNSQEPGTLWFHDHALGITRNNVYAGLAGFYFLRDPSAEPKDLPSGPYEIELAIQDRRFDTNSQLFLPGSGPGPQSWPTDNAGGTPNFHPFWFVQFSGDTAIVNGAPWPYLKVEPRRYRFRILNGANARRFDLHFGGAPVYQIGADDNYFDTPILVNDTACAGQPITPECSDVSLLPGERADVIVDFSGRTGQTIELTNTAPNLLGPNTLKDIMQFQVVSPLKGSDTSCDPAHPDPAHSICARPTPIVRLTDGKGHVAPGVRIDKVRQLTIGELNTTAGGTNPNGEIEEFVNNTLWDGLESPNIERYFRATEGFSELPRVGSTELWEIINYEAVEPLNIAWHPMHTHLVQFQIFSRQRLKGSDENGFDYEKVYDAAFGTKRSAPLPDSCEPGEYCGGYGPPLPYIPPNADGAIGGNPAIGDSSTPSYLSGEPMPPDPGESGWKDTAKAFPGYVTRIVVRFTPTSTPIGPSRSYIGRNFFPFDPTVGTYVWHCHIIDHEDNEMMRPYRVAK